MLTELKTGFKLFLNLVLFPNLSTFALLFAIAFCWKDHLSLHVEIKFSKLAMKPIRLSSGSIQAKRLLLNLWSFTPDLVRKGAIRYPAQFDFHLIDCVFTENDLIRSRSIRNGLQRLLARVLTRAGVSSTQVVVNSIRLLVSLGYSTGILMVSTVLTLLDFYYSQVVKFLVLERLAVPLAGRCRLK